MLWKEFGSLFLCYGNKQDASGSKQEMEIVSLSFSSFNSVGIVLDFIGAFLIVYHGLLPLMNLTNTRLSEVEFERLRVLCWRRCVAGLVVVVAGFGLQITALAQRYVTPVCC